MLDSEPSNYEPAFPPEKEEDEDLGRIGSPPDSVRERSNQESKLSDPPPPPPPPRADTRTEEIIETVPEEVREEEDYNAEVEESKREPIRVREAELSLKDSSDPLYIPRSVARIESSGLGFSTMSKGIPQS